MQGKGREQGEPLQILALVGACIVPSCFPAGFHGTDRQVEVFE
jgi:hypothetical protein